MPINPGQLTIVQYPEPVLRERAKAISKIDDQVRAVATRMIELMQGVKGVGLAAPQVGLGWRMFVTDVPDEGGPKVYINPKLTNLGKEQDTYEEGCLSLPGIHVDVKRPTSATIHAQDLDGHEIVVSSETFAARVWQHELDHLNGVLIIDALSPAERRAAVAALKGGMPVAFSGGRF
jgi:peptide deformylase